MGGELVLRKLFTAWGDWGAYLADRSLGRERERESEERFLQKSQKIDRYVRVRISIGYTFVQYRKKKNRCINALSTMQNIYRWSCCGVRNTDFKASMFFFLAVIHFRENPVRRVKRTCLFLIESPISREAERGRDWVEMADMLRDLVFNFTSRHTRQNCRAVAFQKHSQLLTAR